MIPDEFVKTKRAIKEHVTTLHQYSSDIKKKDELIAFLEQNCKTIESKLNRQIDTMSHMQESMISQCDDQSPIETTKQSIIDEENANLEKLYQNLCQTNDLIHEKIALITDNIERIKKENQYLLEMNNITESPTRNQQDTIEDLDYGVDDDDFDTMEEKYNEILENIIKTKAYISQMNVNSCSHKKMHQDISKLISNLQEQIYLENQSFKQKIKKMSNDIVSNNDDSICQLSMTNNIDFEKHKLLLSKKKLSKKIEDTCEELDTILSAKDLFTEKQNALIDKIEKTKQEKMEFNKKFDDARIKNLKLVKDHKYSISAMRNDIEELKLQNKHEKTLMQLSYSKINQLECQISNVISSLHDEELKERIIIANNKVSSLSEATNLDEVDYSLLYEALTVTLDDLYKKKSKKLAKLEELEKTTVPPIKIDDVPTPKFYSSTKGELKSTLKEILSLHEKISDTEKMLKNISCTVKSIHSKRKQVRKLEVSLKQDHIINENQQPLCIRQIEQSHASETSKLQRKIATKMLSIEETRNRIAKKAQIFKHVLSHYDVSKHPLDFVVLRPKYETNSQNGNYYKNKEKNLEHLIFTLETCIKEVDTQLRGYKFATVNPLYESLAEIWNSEVSKLILSC